MSTQHNHATAANRNEKYLWMALGLTSLFLIIEVIGGLVTGSLALISDAAHMMTDVSALIVSLMAIRIGKKAADIKRTFGYYRLEILAAAFNSILLFFVAIYIVYEAYQRLKAPAEIHSIGMLVIASFGLLVNVISMKLLTGGKDQSLNIKSAYLEVWSDMLGSIGVIIGAVIIRFTQWIWVDSAIAVIIGLWVLPRTWVLLKDTINILLEGVPDGIDLNKLKKMLCEVNGVVGLHELHVWAITSGKISLTAHIVVDSHENCDFILDRIRRVLAEEFDITHTTLQHEVTACDLDNHFVCGIR